MRLQRETILLILAVLVQSFFPLKVDSQETDDLQQRIDGLNQVIIAQYDEMEGITWYNHVQENRDKSIGFYIGEKEDEIWLRFYAGTSGNDWVFFERIFLLGTYEDESKEPLRMEIPIDSTERIDAVRETGATAFSWGGVACDEKVDFPAAGRINLSAMRDLASADTVTIRFSGQVSQREYIIKEEWVHAIIDMLDYWELIVNTEEVQESNPT